MELEGNKRLLVTRQSRRTWSVATVSLRLSFLSGFRGLFGKKKIVLGHKMRSFGRAYLILEIPLPLASPLGRALVNKKCNNIKCHVLTFSLMLFGEGCN